MGRTALVVGSTGIVGGAICERLLRDGWRVLGLARRPERSPAGTIPLRADLDDQASLDAATLDAGIDALFQASWTPAAEETEACRTNADQLRRILGSVVAGGSQLRHVALVTGVKHYLGPFAEFGRHRPETPFLEDMPRLDTPNFYYAQEDVLHAAARDVGFRWSVHRPNTVVGFATGSLMNQGATLACYAAICRETGMPFAFPGVPEQWGMLTEISDSRLVADQVAWACDTPSAAGSAYNAANGDLFRWRSMWGRLAERLGVEAPPYDERGFSLEAAMRETGALDVWRRIAERHELVEPDLGRLATWWHLDADLGRVVECISDMTRVRRAGFDGWRSSIDTYGDLFDRLERERVVPPARP